MLDLLKFHLLWAQQKKSVADGKHRDLQFKVGGLVYPKLRPYRQLLLARCRNEKLCPRYYGPLTITARVGLVAYHLCLPEEVVIHPDFHISQLRHAYILPSTIAHKGLRYVC